jgi:hypothetical protein
LGIRRPETMNEIIPPVRYKLCSLKKCVQSY